MPNIGMSELIVVLMILLLVFGASRLPALGDSLGRTIRSFKRGMASDERIAVREGEPDAAPKAGAKPGAKPGSSEVEDAELVDRKS